VPRLQDRLDIVSTFAAIARELGPANFIYSDGDAVFIHGDRRHHGDGLGIRPPGLHVLESRSASPQHAFDAGGLSVRTGPDEGMILAASVPLTGDPGWRPLAQGEILVLQGATIRPPPAADQK